jgi:uncharacterized protein YndB with AHSA1/START domain
LTEHRERILRIERTFQAPIEAVFDAWTNADVLRSWLHVGPDWETPIAEADLRVGGRIRIVMRDPHGAEHGASGEYRLIERPHRLVFTWAFDEHPEDHQLIELEFTEHEGMASVVMINSGIGTERRWSDQRHGWQGCYDNLERALASSSWRHST